MKYIIFCFLILRTSLTLAEDQSATSFFSNEAKLKQVNYIFNPYETIFSGTIAFVIGNIGYYTTQSTILKLGYSGVQTIGVINVGKGLYKVNSPSVEKELSELLSTQNNKKDIEKEFLSRKLIEIYAREDRAKRIALFYGSSLLSTQYLLNAFIGKTPKELKNIYIFMSGINFLIAGYAFNTKSNYEKNYFGDKFDIRPITFYIPDIKQYQDRLTFSPGIQVNLKF